VPEPYHIRSCADPKRVARIVSAALFAKRIEADLNRIIDPLRPPSPPGAGEGSAS
jgi:hypothetical protein